MPKKILPSFRGITRRKKTHRIHKEVERNLVAIAEAENKSYSYVISEIVYRFFGLNVSDKGRVRVLSFRRSYKKIRNTQRKIASAR